MPFAFDAGWFLGDGQQAAGQGTAGRGYPARQLAQGAAVVRSWISKSDKLIEDAQRDWSALGMERLLVTPLSPFPAGARQSRLGGSRPIYPPTLRCAPMKRGGKKLFARTAESFEWFGSDFDGVIVFDESHAMQERGWAARASGGDQAALSAGARAGLRTPNMPCRMPASSMSRRPAQLPCTILLMPSRLGTMGRQRLPFATRAEFVEAIEEGGKSLPWRCWRATPQDASAL